LLGKQGLREVAQACADKANYAQGRLLAKKTSTTCTRP
jgi:glycine cleavage system pyridoxal-binding protein P